MANFTRYGARQRQPVWGDGSASTSGGVAQMPTLLPPSGSSATPSDNGGPSGWVNVQNYLNANKGAAQQMGTGVASELDKEAQQASKDAETYRQANNTYATQTLKTNPEFNKPWNPDAVLWKKPDQFIPNTDPAPTVPGGPAKVLEKIKTAGTPEGMAQMFADRAGPNYNQGQSNLDSYLARAGGGAQAVQALQQKYGKVLDLVGSPYPFQGDPTKERPTGPEGMPPDGSKPRNPLADRPLPLWNNNQFTATPPATTNEAVSTPDGRLPNEKRNRLRWSA